MKTKISFLTLLIVYILAIVISNTSARKSETTSPLPSSDSIIFMIGAHQSGYEINLYRLRDTLGFNFWMRYLGKDSLYSNHYRYPTGWTNDDQLLDPIPGSVGQILSNNFGRDLKTIMHRPKIEWLAFGSRSDYQCESIDSLHQSLRDYWFYTYRDTITTVGVNYIDNSQFGNNGFVRGKYCSPNNYSTDGGQTFIHMDSGYVVKDLRANREQINVKNTAYGPPYPGFGDRQFDWYILPRIRINPSDANDTTKVCRIEVINFKGDTIKKVDILGNNFLNSSYYYDGSYLDIFKGNTDSLEIIGHHNGDTLQISAFNPDGIAKFDSKVCHVDFRVFWYGQCDMWIDRIRVEDERAHRLLTKTDQEFEGMLTDEHNLASNNSGTAYRFYTEEFEFKHLPCLKYVYDRLREGSPVKAFFYGSVGTGWYADHIWRFGGDTTYNGDDLGVAHFIHHFIDSLKPAEYFYGSYPFYRLYHTKSGGTDTSMIPNTLLIHSGGILDSMAIAMNPNDYDNWLQRFMEDSIDHGNQYRYGEFFKFLKRLKKLTDSSTTNPINLISAIQAHSLHGGGDGELREPTNEEIEMMVNVSLTYGSKGIIYNQYISWGDENWNSVFSRGLIERTSNYNNINPRDTNDYGQNKWQKIIDINKKLKKWGPYLMSFNSASSKSYIYRLSSERNNLLSEPYFLEAITYKHDNGSGLPDCTEDNPGLQSPLRTIYECKNDRYLQVAIFNKTSDDGNRYFMIVNRRCSPDTIVNNDSTLSGKRFVKIRLNANSSSFEGYNNWGIIDLYTGDTVSRFDKRTQAALDLGWYMPGEGKLYKITPVMKTGGTLVCDESISNVTFNCDSTVYNNGHNITIGANTTINFSNNGKIVMDGGNFICGSSNAITNNVTLRNKTGENWDGLELNDCDTIYMVYSTIQGLKSNNTIGLNISNCGNIFIANNSFSLSDLDVTPLEINLSSIPDTSLIGIYNNNFNVNYTTGAVVILSTAALQVPVYIQNNTIISQNEGSSIGILLNNVSLGVVTENSISNFRTGIHLQSSSADLYGNNIQAGTKGVNSTASSDANLSPTRSASGLYYTGGNNIIDAVNSDGNDLYAENSYFYTSRGKNTFNIINPGTFHFSGYFPDNCNSNYTYDADNNCFKVENADTVAISNTACGLGMSPVNFNFLDYYCQAFNYDQMEILAVSNFIRDTIRINTNGAGGTSNDQFSMLNVKLRVDENQTQTTYKSLKDSININMRKRNYNSVINQCTELLNNYSDSSFASDAISKLYVSSLKTDNNGNKIGPLRTYFETLILNHSNNLPIIKKANYFVQKCKVSLKQYASALQGFQEIINQNPYSYEGLVASWDYSATQLLSIGSGGNNNEQLIMSNEEYENVEQDEGQNESYSQFTSDISLKEDFSFFASHISFNIEAMMDTLNKRKVNFISVTSSDYDKSKFTQKDRQQIQTNIESAFNDERSKQINKLKELEKQVTKSANTNTSDVELIKANKEIKTMKSLGQVVKVKKPKNIKEHINFINADIKKVFGVDKITNNKNSKNLLPTEFNLSQNYPNPFNPVTKINYDLPKDAKVKLVIYNILGQEIKVLVNNEFKQAGRYTIEFNGSYLASGIYFYRIQVEGGKSYTAVKKMVLVK